LFSNENGLLLVDQELVRSQYYEFSLVMKEVYQNLSKKYDELILQIINDKEYDDIDFPLECEILKFDGLFNSLPDDIK
jgi:hypothetical protein